MNPKTRHPGQVKGKGGCLVRSFSQGDLSAGRDGPEGAEGAEVRPRAVGIASLFIKNVSNVVASGPKGPPNQYSKMKSKIMSKTLNPEYNQKFEMHLQGGEIDNNGDYRNPLAAFTKFRLTMWYVPS